MTTTVYVIGALWLPTSYTIKQYCPALIVPLSCGVAPADVVVNPPDDSWHVPPTSVPTPMPIEIVAGGPADVRSTLMANPLDVTVNGLESFDPTCTVPEKFSVTSGDDGVVGNVVELSLEESEQAAADNAVATIRHAMVCLTFTLLENVYVS